ncbi:hypothetical protein [Microvirga sesbaniae]|uniref:hypothetical protein n=1 Tax=Microvirga sesbaniae TaxID=681392 RepID=UPI0021C6FD95|nr:hypothetical protein [Microvirga sp. HBU67692]
MTKVDMRYGQLFAKTRQRPLSADKKKPGSGPAKLRSDKSVKTFQRERLRQQRREEEGGAALKSAFAYIGGIAPLYNAACLMKGLR